uniref:RNA polymerase I-specific transcription initiation factor RRN3 n=2 Tax=Lygus hesperus TaxID=30085 RepID=A0A146LTP3_LYGHE
MSFIGRTSLGPSGSKTVRFQIDFNLKAHLLEHANQDSNKYEELVRKIRDHGQEIRDEDLSQLLKEARGCISMLNGNFRLFVQVVLILDWTHRSPEVVSEYQGFLLDLCAAHNYYTKHVIDQLITSFKRDSSEWKDGVPTEESVRRFQHIHDAIRQILTIVPMSKDILISQVQSLFPYFKRSAHEHETFIYNVLQIIQYLPGERYGFLKMIITQLITLDVHSPRSALEEREAGGSMEVDGIFEMDDVKHPVAHTLDVSLNILYRYVRDDVTIAGNVNMDKLKPLFNDLVKVFEEVILPTHATQHVQFLVFFILGLKPPLCQMFIRNLWKKVTDPNIPPIIRQAAVCYIASIIARAKYISILTTQAQLTEMATWIHKYISSQDEGSVNMPAVDTRIHGVFYATCQALFYIIAFRYKELVHNTGLSMLQSLNLSKIVTCRLNPLKACAPVVVSNFAAIARSFQLAYCYTVIERNQRNNLPIVNCDTSGSSLNVLASVHLDSFFPFDPYLLNRTKKYVEPHYREYTGPKEENVASSSKPANDDDDDFLEGHPIAESAAAHFSYSTSPGFLHLHLQ